MILGRGLMMNGTMTPVVCLLGRLWSLSAYLGMLVTLVVVVIASAFLSDMPMPVLMLPMVLILHTIFSILLARRHGL